MVSDEVTNYLLGYAKAECKKNDIECNLTKKLADASLKMIARDFDGRFIVSYLGEFFRTHLLDGTDNEIYILAKSFIDEELQKHQQAQNSKLAFRYALLHGYFHEHLV